MRGQDRMLAQVPQLEGELWFFGQKKAEQRKSKNEMVPSSEEQLVKVCASTATTGSLTFFI
jgi:hypothetical protein